AEVRNELGALLNERRRFADATVELKRAVADKPDLAEAWFNLGQAAAMTKDCATALDAYTHALKLSATDADGVINASVAARRCKRIRAMCRPAGTWRRRCRRSTNVPILRRSWASSRRRRRNRRRLKNCAPGVSKPARFTR